MLATHSTAIALAASRLGGVRMFRSVAGRPYAIEPGLRETAHSNSRALMDEVLRKAPATPQAP